MWRALRRFLSGPQRVEVITDEVLGTIERPQYRCSYIDGQPGEIAVDR
jgi:hypothetical protein